MVAVESSGNYIKWSAGNFPYYETGPLFVARVSAAVLEKFSHILKTELVCDSFSS